MSALQRKEINLKLIVEGHTGIKIALTGCDLTLLTPCCEEFVLHRAGTYSCKGCRKAIPVPFIPRDENIESPYWCLLSLKTGGREEAELVRDWVQLWACDSGATVEVGWE